MITTTPNLFLDVKIDSSTTVRFEVRKMQGWESISEPFTFDLDLLSDNTDRALGDLLYKPATFTMTRLFNSGIHESEATMVRKGILADIRLVGRQGYDPASYRRIYRARLVPQVWKMSLQQRSQVFTAANQTIKSIALSVLAESLTETGRSDCISATTTFVARDMVVQYQESDLHFLSRWLEHEGIHYTFDHAGDSDKVVLSDSNNFANVAIHDQMSFADNLGTLSAGAGIEYDNRVTSLVCHQGLMPRTVVLQGYDWMSPSAYIVSKAYVDEAPESSAHRGIGTHTEYNSRFSTQAEGNRLARIRAQGFLCRELTYRGTARSPFFSAGKKFRLNGHYNSDLNRDYLLVEVTHHAEQVAHGSTQDGTSWHYHNEFTAVPADRTYRPERRTPWPSITGMINGKIHDPVGAEAAPVDIYGRYLVRLPFATDATTGTLGQNTCRVRMAQPYVGTDFGMHFPLHDGTEVTLSFIDGDPDRPVITGALFDGTHHDPVNERNSTQGGIKTKSGSSIGFEDRGGNSKISLAAGSGGTAITIGTLAGGKMGPLVMNNVQIATTKLDILAGLMVGQSSPMIINNSVVKWLAVASPLNLLFMIAPLVSKAGQDGQDPVLGIEVQPSDQKNIDAANAVMFTLMQTVLQLTMANILATKAGYAAKLTLVSGSPKWTTKLAMVLKTSAMNWLMLPVGGVGLNGISLSATGVLNAIDATGIGKNISIFSRGSIKIQANEDIIGISSVAFHYVAPKFEFFVGNQLSPAAAVTDKSGSITMDGDGCTIHSEGPVALYSGSGPVEPLRSALELKPEKAELAGGEVGVFSFSKTKLISGPGKLALIEINGVTSKVLVSGEMGVDIKSSVAVNLTAGGAKIAMGPSGIRMSFGSSSIEIGPGGIKVTSLAQVNVKGTKVSVEADLMAEVKGAMVNIKPSGLAGLG